MSRFAVAEMQTAIKLQQRDVDRAQCGWTNMADRNADWEGNSVDGQGMGCRSWVLGLSHRERADFPTKQSPKEGARLHLGTLSLRSEEGAL